MPRYFFDTYENGRLSTDEGGLDFADHEQARRAAISSLPQMAADRLPDGDRDEFAVEIRDAHGAVLYRATLTLAAEWLSVDKS